MAAGGGGSTVGRVFCVREGGVAAGGDGSTAAATVNSGTAAGGGVSDGMAAAGVKVAVASSSVGAATGAAVLAQADSVNSKVNTPAIRQNKLDFIVLISAPLNSKRKTRSTAAWQLR